VGLLKDIYVLMYMTQIPISFFSKWKVNSSVFAVIYAHTENLQTST